MAEAAPQPFIGMLRILRCMAQPVADEASVGPIQWSISSGPVFIGDDEKQRPGLIGDILVVVEGSVQIGVSGLVTIEDYPGPADGESFTDDELDVFLRDQAATSRHVLWDAISSAARMQASIVGVHIELPLLTPEPLLLPLAEDADN